jgi:hypothetical protein
LLVLTCGFAAYGLTQHAGAPLLKEIGELPGFRIVGQDYWATWTAGGLALATGISIASIRRRGASVRAVQAVGGLFAAAFAVAIFSTRDVTLTRAAVVSIVAALALILVLITLVMAFTRNRIRGRTIATVAVALIGIELLAYQPHVRMRRSELYGSVPSFVSFLRDNIGPYRILNAGRGGVYAEWGTVLRIPQVETMNTTQLPHYRGFFLAYLNPLDFWHFLQTGKDGRQQFAVDPYALDLLSVRYLVVDQKMTMYDAGVRAQYPLVFEDREARVRVYENPDPFPRAYLSSALALVQPADLTEREEFRRLVRLVRGEKPSPPTFTVATAQTEDRKLLAAARRERITADAPGSAGAGRARVTRYENTEVRVEVDARRPALLVLTDSHHGNWKATVDGRAAHVGRVNQAVRGVVVPAGRSTVVFRYRSRPRDVGALVTIATVAVLLAVVATDLWRRRRSRSDRSADDVVLDVHVGG